MKKEVLVKPDLVLITVGNEFVTFSRQFTSEGFGGATFSFRLTPKIINRIESSGIVKVEQFNDDGILKYRRLDFYTLESMIDVFSEILEYSQNLNLSNSLIQ